MCGGTTSVGVSVLSSGARGVSHSEEIVEE
jgi:hypothetical protein